jgi:hypothetical protein
VFVEPVSKMPNQFSAKAALRFLSSGYKFFVGKKYKWQYVQAIVNVQKKQLNFYVMGKLIKSVAYS